MPLDVQPLSRARRAMMVLVLLALFAGSLGLAQGLVVKRENEPVWVVDFVPPADMQEAVPQNQLFEGWTVAFQGSEAGLLRRIVGVSLAEGDVTADESTWEPYVVELFARATGAEVDTERPIIPLAKGLAGRPALEMTRVFADGRKTAFTVVRVTGIEGRIVAICFSGAGPYTDADKEYLENYCARNVKIHAEKRLTGK